MGGSQLFNTTLGVGTRILHPEQIRNLNPYEFTKGRMAGGGVGSEVKAFGLVV